MDTSDNEELEDVRNQLIACQGGTAQLYFYTASHAQLQLEVRKEDNELYIICNACMFIQGPIDWDNCTFTLDRVSTNIGPGYILKDESSGFSLTCLGPLGVLNRHTKGFKPGIII